MISGLRLQELESEVAQEIAPQVTFAYGVVGFDREEVSSLICSHELILASFQASLSERVRDSTQIANIFENLFWWAEVNEQTAEVVDLIQELAGDHRSFECLIDNIICYGRCNRSQEQILAFIVSLLCEVGISLLNSNHRKNDVITTLTAYLVSLSNQSNDVHRLCLLNYFCVYSAINCRYDHLIKIMNRFGYMTLTRSFSGLFSLRDESDWQRGFLMKYLPIFFALPGREQLKLAEVLKFSMLNQPGMFISFMKHLLDKSDLSKIKLNDRRVIHAHLHALLDIACSVDHKYLVVEIITLIEMYNGDSAKNESIDILLAKEVFRGRLRKILMDARKKGASAVSFYHIHESKADLVEQFCQRMCMRWQKQITPIVFWNIIAYKS